MSFSIKVNGEEVHTLPDDQRLTHLAVMSNKGVIGEANIEPAQGEINIIATYADPRDVHLIDLQAAQRPQNVTEEQAAEAYPAIVPNTPADVLSGTATTEHANDHGITMSDLPAEDEKDEKETASASSSKGKSKGI